MTTLIILNDEINDIIKILKSLENSGSLLKGFAETVQNEVKEKKESLTGRGINRAGKGKDINRVGEGVLRAGYGNNMGF